jgi:phage terminase large subunit GpA-like protein
MRTHKDSRTLQVWRDAVNAILPAPRLTVSQWADANRILDNTSPEPGPWRTDRTPFLREIMDSLSPAAPCERVVFVKSAQCGGTEVLLNTCGYLMHYTPAPTLLVQPSVEMAKRFSKQRLDALIESTPALRGRVRDPRSRDSGNTILMKEFAGGVLILTGANSAVGLRSLPAKYVLCDELDGWPADADSEGDPFQLACKRTVAFGTQRKILAVSTPTLEGLSRIEALYKVSDQRRYFVPCPRCGHFQVFTWAGVVWDKDKPETARYRCEGCETLIQNWQKTEMLARGEWRATAAGDGKTRGYHISALYAPVGWPSWGDLAAEFLEASKSRETLQVFCNTVWGEAWKDEATLPLDADALFARREPFDGVPMGACLLTAGADVQGDRIEVEIVGWGEGEESWSVAYHVLYGDTGQPEVWSALDRLLLRPWRHESGLELPISAACIDAGFEMAQVLEFCRPRLARKVYAIKGAPGFGKPVWPRRASKGVHKAEFFMVGSDTAKERVYSKLRVSVPGAGYCHFPLNRERDWFDMLTAERIKTRTVHGRAERYFYKPDGVRNEGLDCRAYSTAALHALYMSGFKLADQAARLKSMAAGKGEPEPAYQVYKSRFVSG